jgi:hypothetical protein
VSVGTRPRSSAEPTVILFAGHAVVRHRPQERLLEFVEP